MAGFQTQVGTLLAPAVEGDFASANPYRTFLAGPGGLVTGAQGTYVGRFAWVSYSRMDGDNAPAAVNNFGAGAPHGFVHREMQGLITTYLAEGGLWIPPSFTMGALMDWGDFWIRNTGATAALVGMKAYADVTTGLASFAATGTPGSANTTGSVAAGTGSATGSINGNVLSITGATTGQFYPGATISGTGVATGTKIVAQLTSTESGGTLGGRGTYAVSIPEQSVASTTISATYGIMTLTAGSATVGDALSGANVTTGSVVTALGVGANAGKYIVDPTQTAASATIATGLTVETPWYAASAGLANELVKITRINPLGG